MEPRDTFSSTTVRKTVVFFPDPSTGRLWRLPENGDRVCLVFICNIGFMQATPKVATQTNDQTQFALNPDAGSYQLVPETIEQSNVLTIDYGTFGPLAQVGWDVVCDAGTGWLTVLEVFDNPTVRHNLGCK